jgi:hypothetical protein
MRYITLLLALLFAGKYMHAQMIVTIAGNGSSGYAGDSGPATSAQVDQVVGIATDLTGNLYVGDYLNHRLRKVSTSGLITTIAGTGVPTVSGDGGPASAATIGNIALKVATDTSGNIYLSQSGKIRKIDPSGFIHTIAGTGTVGYSGDGGPALSATIGTIYGMITDAAGALYFTDWQACRVRKISGGIIATIAGNGSATHGGDGLPATSASMRPKDIALDAAGNLYIATQEGGTAGYNYIRKVNTSGIISTIAGTGTPGYSGDGGPATAAAIFFSGGLCADASGNIYFTDGTHRIRKISTSGIITTIAGIGTAGFAGDGCAPADAQLNSPYDLDIDTAGNIYIADALNYRIRKIAAGNPPSFTGGSFQFIAACGGTPASINSFLSVSDADAGQALVWAPLSTPAYGTLVATYTGVAGGITTPTGLTYTAAAGYTGPDTFSVVVTDCAGAADTTTLFVTVQDSPVAGSVTGSDTVCEGNTTALTATATGGVWSSSNLAVAIINSTGTVTGIAPGTTAISYTVSNACGSAVAMHPISVKPAALCAAGFTQATYTSAPIVWPNPGNGYIHIAPAGSMHTPAQIIITTTDGRAISNFTTTAGSIVTTQLPPGFYMVRITTADTATCTKVVVK